MRGVGDAVVNRLCATAAVGAVGEGVLAAPGVDLQPAGEHVVVVAFAQPRGEVGSLVHRPAGLRQRQPGVVASAQNPVGVRGPVGGIADVVERGPHFRIVVEPERLGVAGRGRVAPVGVRLLVGVSAGKGDAEHLGQLLWIPQFGHGLTSHRTGTGSPPDRTGLWL